jgi:phospholipid/cholesterol/gamma-HCH transport system permease protein
MHEQDRSLAIDWGDGERGPTEVRLRGRVGLAEAERLWSELLGPARTRSGPVHVELSGVERMDGAGAAMLLAIRAEVKLGGGHLELSGARPGIQRLLEDYGCPTEHQCLAPPPKRIGTLDHVGRATVGTIATLREILSFLGNLVAATLAAVREPRSVNWRDLGKLMERAGADGLPIVLILNGLVGFIIALQAAHQLAPFGAGIFIADMVGLSMTRELAPLMTAIIVAGRSGAAFAAELGTMNVSEEIDALRAMHVDPHRHLVLPRVIALCAVVPLLTIGADVVGCLGGLVVVMTSLDIGPESYFNALQNRLDLWDVGGGLLKSVVFALTIALIACQRGLWARNGAQGVGSATTSAVVAIILALIVWDTIFTVLFNVLGI